MCFKKELVPLPLLFLTYIVVSTIASGELDFKWVEHKASLLFIPLLFSSTHKIDPQKIFKSFVYGCLLAYLICFFLALKSSLHITELGIQFNPLLNPNRGFFESMVYEGNYFFGGHFSQLQQISYFALYLSFAIGIVLFYSKPLKVRWPIVAALTLGVVQTASLAGVVNLIMIYSFYLWSLLKDRKLQVLVIIGFAAFIALSAKYHPRINTTLKGTYKTLINDNSAQYPKQPRLLAWKGATRAVAQNGAFGVGLGNAQKELNKHYDYIGFERGVNENLNAHNQYLQTLLECGIIGLTLLLMIMYKVFRTLKKRIGPEKQIGMVFLLLLTVNFLFENLLNRYIGISFFSFFLCLILTMNEDLN
ncbi:O-antigen ligase family protein [Flagellimonas aequoris]|uniref:O-antigen ligase family protein n=1 Tax=Flagellimonas aequoris TaxID=2306997 RepID=A0A418N9L3_9FLAO|nr:O-antigen ligase family protein [Allomuricauda aequoris]